ncbi:uncharacterized protein LOC121372952 [Gigantopelta aegis]|uniref:uncharacterized protein LOC121372952 n=1 Tax=Gigantopelta aegis TaxID=1735272 RepID=UPI001B889251|nr:uncharacterized protein LOC121372952 [Gigantopelta aegis]
MCKPLMSAPFRLQIMILKVKGYDLKVEYIPGKTQFIADTLSRASLDETPPEDDRELKVNMLQRLSVSQSRDVEFQQKTSNELHELYAIIQSGWPDTKQQVPHAVRQFWDARDELAVLDGVIYRVMRIVVPPTMRTAMLNLIHETYMGIVKTKQRAREILYWPSRTAQIEEKVSDCAICHDYAAAQQKEPLIPSQAPDLPWVEVASDIFMFNGDNYILSIDYYSKYIEVTLLKRHVRT